MRTVLEQADLRVLLMALWQITGDETWLSERYQPGRDINLIADEAAGLAPEIQAEIRDSALNVLSGDTEAAIAAPDPERMPELMSFCLGESVPEEYSLMMREEMGFTSRFVERSGKRPAAPDRPVIIVGAGASGMAIATNLDALGIPFLIIEKNAEVGGTWLENRYPGCAVDTPNHAYSFSFGSREPWTRYFSRRDALLDYMVKRSHEFGLRDRIRFHTRVVRCDWVEDVAFWRVVVDGAEGEDVIEGWALVSAIGPISVPKLPGIDGVTAFQGDAFHSARWPEDYDVTGKRVAVIGTGASSMQIVPSIAEKVKHLTIYQRTPQWVRHIPRFQDEMSPGQQWLLEHVPFYASWFRFTMLWRYGDGLLRTLRRDPEWPQPQRAMNRINDRHRIQMTEFIEAELDGRPDLLEKCLPSYPPYAKRILLDNRWYKTLRRRNVDLVTDPITRITRQGVETSSAAQEFDTIVFATGFEVFRNAARLSVTGRNGARLDEEWSGDDPKAYLGITVPGMPNFFILQGPNTVLAHGGSAIFTTECQSRYAVGCLVGMLERGLTSVSIRRDVHDAYMDRVDAEHRELVWNHPGLVPWYRNASGRIAAALPWRLVDYRAMCDAPDFEDYETVAGTSS